MQEQIYSNRQLYKTLTKLSGNMQLDLILKSVGSKLQVDASYLRPVTPQTSYVPDLKEDITVRPHQLNIKRFFDFTRGSFFDFKADSTLMSDWPIIIDDFLVQDLKYFKNWDDTFWAGTQRMSYKLYGTTHEMLVPLWIEKAQGLRLKLSIGAAGFFSKYTLEISQDALDTNSKSFHNKFIKYLLDYLRYTGISFGNNDLITIDFKNNKSFVAGINVESGNLEVKKDIHLARNLLFRERPLLEVNSMLINSLVDRNLIAPQHINLNLCFDIDDLLDYQTRKIVKNNPNCRVYCDVEVLNDGEWEPVTKADFYTNHDYVPRLTIHGPNGFGQEYYDDDSYWKNALDHLNDDRCSEIMHYNKIVQPICHWQLTDDKAGELFNTYDGFGAVYIDGEDVYEYGHGFGIAPDPIDQNVNATVDNTKWLGTNLLVGGQAEVEKILNNPQKYIDSGHLKDMSKNIQGIKFNYKDDGSENSPEKIYIGLMTSPDDMNIHSRATAHSVLMNNRDYVGILIDRISHGIGNSLQPNKNALEQLEYRLDKSKMDEFDLYYDWHQYSDIDNRYKMGKSKKSNFYLREYDNIGVLYVCTRRMKRYIEGKDKKVTQDPKAPLVIIFWAPSWKLLQDDTITPNSVLRSYSRDGLVLGRLMTALKKYLDKYGPLWNKADDKSNLPNIPDLEFANSSLTSLQIPETLWFNRSIVPEIDTKVSLNSTEITYRKTNDTNAWVWRYSGKIRPAMFEPQCKRVGDKLKYKAGLGRNFAYQKQMIFAESTLPGTIGIPKNINGYKKYVHTNIAPCYPSLGYDSVLIQKRDNCQKGDLLYDEPHPLFFGKFPVDEGYEYIANHPGYQLITESKDPNYSFAWTEYKWFDHSRITSFEKSFEFEIGVDAMDDYDIKEELEKLALGEIQKRIGFFILDGKESTIDKVYIKKLYDLEYNLQTVKRLSDTLYTYTYLIKASLK